MELTMLGGVAAKLRDVKSRNGCSFLCVTRRSGTLIKNR
jgi:hypothetical protein